MFVDCVTGSNCFGYYILMDFGQPQLNSKKKDKQFEKQSSNINPEIKQAFLLDRNYASFGNLSELATSVLSTSRFKFLSAQVIPNHTIRSRQQNVQYC